MTERSAVAMTSRGLDGHPEGTFSCRSSPVDSEGTTMGKSYVQHSDLCGCERCAAQGDSENPSPIFDVVDDPDVRDCGCPYWRSCDCGDYDPD
jgi:hypothetical protein